MILLQALIHQTYFLMSAVIAVVLGGLGLHLAIDEFTQGLREQCVLGGRGEEVESAPVFVARGGTRSFSRGSRPGRPLPHFVRHRPRRAQKTTDKYVVP